MKIVFFGTPPFAANVLNALIDHGEEIVGVISRPDRAKGRSGKPVPTPVKEVAMERIPEVPFYQPEKVSEDSFADTLKALEADLFVVVAYGEILRQHVLDVPKLACINVHASLLPKYRGAAPIQRCIMEGETETGITIMHMVRKMDAGAMIRQSKVEIGPNMTFGELEEELCVAGIETLLAVLEDFRQSLVNEVEQDENQVTFAPKIELEECEIDWGRSAQEVHNLVRGVNPYPGAWCQVKVRGEEKRMKVLRTEIVSGGVGRPGEWVNEREMVVGCGKDAVRLLEVKLEGKRAMEAGEFLRGTPIGSLQL